MTEQTLNSAGTATGGGVAPFTVQSRCDHTDPSENGPQNGAQRFTGVVTLKFGRNSRPAVERAVCEALGLDPMHVMIDELELHVADDTVFVTYRTHTTVTIDAADDAITEAITGGIGVTYEERR